jgi:hypothetical protein
MTARFWSKVDVREPGECWPWTAYRDRFGYGSYRELTTEVAHRVAYQLTNGPVPRGTVVRHQCDNPACCNPAHLLAGSHATNVADRVARRRSATAANGRWKGGRPRRESNSRPLGS